VSPAGLQEQLHLLDVGAIVVLGDRLDARTLAALDVVQQAGPLEGAFAILDIDRAGTEREEPPNEVHRFVDAGRGGVRPEVAAPVVDQLPGPLDAREVVGQRDLDVRVALVVLQANVEARLEPLDEVVLEKQRLADAVDLRDLDVGDPVDDAPDPVALAHGRLLLLPIAPHPVAQALRLADVQDVTAGVLEQVDTRSIG